MVPANQEHTERTIFISAIVGSIGIGGSATLLIASGDLDDD
jgi:hypothetical protein